MKFKLKNDSFRQTRGGGSKILEITCSKCEEIVAYYQKDGKGGLVRTYLDRFHHPEALVEKMSKCTSTSDMENLECPHCNEVLGTPMVYKPENRLAFRLIPGKIKTSIYKNR